TPHFSLNGQKMWGRVVSLYDGDTLTIALNVFSGVYKSSNAVELSKCSITHLAPAFSISRLVKFILFNENSFRSSIPMVESSFIFFKLNTNLFVEIYKHITYLCIL
ncbi:MAG: hypothetical protein EBT39_05310, partial [Sphingobacteriia bacterium]|nr:hypothetical protein [Candidatus Fonsibacter lacus]